MKIIVLGTNHDVQEKGYQGTKKFRSVLDYIIREWQIEVVMEEWTEIKNSTVGGSLASERGIQWSNVGTPSLAEFKTYIPLCNPMEMTPLVIGRYGPLPTQIKRKEYMVTEIKKAMGGKNCGLFIVGQRICTR